MKKRITSEFVRGTVMLTWPEVLWLLEQERTSWDTPVDIAMALVVEAPQPAAPLLELAAVTEREARCVPVLVKTLAEEQRTEPDAEKLKYLLLRWIHHNRGEIDDPWDEIEDVYCDFDHPEDLAPLVRYMPPSPSDPDNVGLPSMFRKWEKYLEKGAEIYAPSKGNGAAPGGRNS